MKKSLARDELGGSKKLTIKFYEFESSRFKLTYGIQMIRGRVWWFNNIYSGIRIKNSVSFDTLPLAMQISNSSCLSKM